MKFLLEKFNYFVTVILITVTINVNAYDKEYCLNLESIVKNKENQKTLINWIDLNFKNSFINLDGVTSLYQGIRPGRYSLIKPKFDWRLINFDTQKSRIMLIGLNLLDFSEIKKERFANSESIDSFLFAEKLHYGILVKLKDSKQFVNNPHSENLNIITDRISIICGVTFER
jgi:hypothetical protein